MPRPERMRQKSTASIVISSPPSPWVKVPPAGPVRCSVHGLAVAPAPLGGGVGDDATVVLGGELHRLAGGLGDVGPVHPGVAGEDDVDEVAHLPASPSSPSTSSLIGMWRISRRLARQRAATGPAASRRSMSSPVLRPAVRVDLHGGEAVDERAVARPLAAGPHVRGDLAEPGEGLGHAEHVAGHRPHVPERAVGGPGPVVGVERSGAPTPCGRPRPRPARSALGPLDRAHVRRGRRRSSASSPPSRRDR